MSHASSTRSDAPGFNDLFVDAAGRIICGSMRSDPFATEGQRTTGEAWLLAADGTATELYGDIALTNGIGFSPDGTCSITPTRTRGCGLTTTTTARVATDDCSSRVTSSCRTVSPSTRTGVVWVADVWGSGGVRGFAPDGTEVDRIDVPAPMVTSVCFGGT